MGYYNNYTSAHRNGYYVSGAEYNKMQMQAEMTAEAYARQNPGMDMKAFATTQADAMVDAFTNALQREREAQESAERHAQWVREENRRYAEACEVQKGNLIVLDDVIAGNVQVANIPENREEALAVCQYIKNEHKYPAPWGNELLTKDYRNLVQAFLDRADAHTIKGLTAICVNEWIARCRLLRIKADTQDVLAWREAYDNLVEIQQ